LLIEPEGGEITRVLVALDTSDNARLAAHLAGCLIGARHLAASVIDLGKESGGDDRPLPAHALVEAADAAAQAATAHAEATVRKQNDAQAASIEPPPESRPIGELVSVVRPGKEPEPTVEAAVGAILDEAENGYDLLIIGLDEHRPDLRAFQTAVGKIVHEFKGHVAILVHGPHQHQREACCEKILVPTTGADYSRFGAEIAIAIAKGCGGTITALHVETPPTESELLRGPQTLERPARTLLDDIVALGERESVRVKSRAVVGAAKENEIVRQARRGGHQLIVLGTKAWSGEELHFGHSAEAIIENTPGPVLVVKT
jgi:nucleotide-binding universal stress UspA family protein